MQRLVILKLLYQGILTLTEVSNEIDLRKDLQYELSNYAPAFLNEVGIMRDAAKSILAKKILPRSNHAEYVEMNSNHQVVKYGGALIHDVKWEQGESFLDVMNKYTIFLEKSHLCMKSYIAFDGYSSSTRSFVIAKETQLSECLYTLMK